MSRPTRVDKPDLNSLFKTTRFAPLAHAISHAEARQTPGNRTDPFAIFMSYISGENKYGASSDDISEAQMKCLLPFRLLDVEAMLLGRPTLPRAESRPIASPKRIPLEHLNKVPKHYAKFQKLLSAHLLGIERGVQPTSRSPSNPGYRMVLYADMSRRVARKQIDLVLGNLASASLHISCLMKGHMFLPSGIANIEALIIDNANEETRMRDKAELARLHAELQKDDTPAGNDEDVLDAVNLMQNTLCIALLFSPILLLIPREYTDIGGKDGLVNLWSQLGDLERPPFIQQAERLLWNAIFSVAEGKNLVEELAPILPSLDEILNVTSSQWLTIVSRAAPPKPVPQPPTPPMLSFGPPLVSSSSDIPLSLPRTHIHPDASLQNDLSKQGLNYPHFSMFLNPSDLSWLRNVQASPFPFNGATSAHSPHRYLPYISTSNHPSADVVVQYPIPYAAINGGITCRKIFNTHKLTHPANESSSQMSVGGSSDVDSPSNGDDSSPSRGPIIIPNATTIPNATQPSSSIVHLNSTPQIPPAVEKDLLDPMSPAVNNGNNPTLEQDLPEPLPPADTIFDIIPNPDAPGPEHELPNPPPSSTTIETNNPNQVPPELLPSADHAGNQEPDSGSQGIPSSKQDLPNPPPPTTTAINDVPDVEMEEPPASDHEVPNPTTSSNDDNNYNPDEIPPEILPPANPAGNQEPVSGAQDLPPSTRDLPNPHPPTTAAINDVPDAEMEGPQASDHELPNPPSSSNDDNNDNPDHLPPEFLPPANPAGNQEPVSGAQGLPPSKQDLPNSLPPTTTAINDVPDTEMEGPPSSDHEVPNPPPSLSDDTNNNPDQGPLVSQPPANHAGNYEPVSGTQGLQPSEDDLPDPLLSAEIIGDNNAQSGVQTSPTVPNGLAKPGSLPLRSSARLGEKASQTQPSGVSVYKSQAASRSRRRNGDRKSSKSTKAKDFLSIADVPFVDLTLEETDDESTSKFDAQLDLSIPIIFHAAPPVKLRFTGECDFYEFTPRFHPIQLERDVTWANLMLEEASRSYRPNDPFIKVMNKSEYEDLVYEDIEKLLRTVACIVVVDPCYVKPGFTKRAFADVCSLNEPTFLHGEFTLETHTTYKLSLR
ncbi:hypothetical protein H0H93_012045 [Arthromyces matolae]|nr:hypothetical protein H0H93_012045 [Arthromyces matolae]